MIQLHDVSKTYAGQPALSAVNLTIERGEFVAILGPSGCGKTTLLKLLAGFIKPTVGTITIDGVVVASPSHALPPEKRNIGMVFQSFALWPHMTVAEHIRFPLLHHRYVTSKLKENIEQRVREVLKLTGMDRFADRYPAELSGGQKQRVSLGRAIAPLPGLLLMDEPLSALDAELRMELRREIQAIHQQTQAAIVYVTHDQSEALAMADRVIVMNDGHIEQAAPPETIYTQPQSPFVATFVGKCNLVEGRWEGECFRPAHAPAERWPDTGVVAEFKRQNLYPVRPEQFKLFPAGETSVAATVTFAQYQGQEIHYTVQVGEQTWTIYQPASSRRFMPGERVGLVPVFAEPQPHQQTLASYII
ncbi:iron(III) transport system ATP-binding protein [Caldalkalibacillus uzonensis]|uniref:Iron(III) transport system ATP-binding protein n=1 Tax=Caldalkalibacillus uzonensis TaxID=353224 RepID=A0ABU0CXC3_9BACI|nr:ABC transporter ATP-binding protein [Caldalkalibacillus uzonensis]MDQ0340684.1 iron(III) transport system ATP-binding protein [Caldalkalibacillus uzonensis]